MFNNNESNVIGYIGSIPVLNIMDVKGYSILNFNGTGRTKMFLSAKDIAIGAGLDFVANGNYEHKKINATSGINFNNNLDIKWDRFNQYAEYAISNLAYMDPDILSIAHLPYGEYSYMPSEVAYLAVMQCRGEKARQFQAIIADIIIPRIVDETIKELQKNYEAQIKKQQDEIINLNSKYNFTIQGIDEQFATDTRNIIKENEDLKDQNNNLRNENNNLKNKVLDLYRKYKTE